jgi:predicted kinase
VSQFLLQMTGEPGAGKSTLAAAIGRETGAIVIDKDVIKSRILDGDRKSSLEGLADSIAAPLHHLLVFDLAGAFLAQGFSVIVDGAAFYPRIRAKGRAAAEPFGARYLLIECYLPDLVALQVRIDSSVRVSSQPTRASLGGFDRPGTAPLVEPHLRIDTRLPFDQYLAEALDYVRNG